MACKFLDYSGTGTIDDAIECLQYVKTMKTRGVNIVATNNSWGSPAYSQALYDAISGQKDILFVAAAGNDNTSAPFYPAAYDLPNIISVAASDESDLKAPFSNFNKWGVDIAAPGTNILSTMSGVGYGKLSGTSMAAPHVSGLAALLKAKDASLTTPLLKNLILAGGDPVSAFADFTVTGRRINAYKSLTCTNSPLFAVLHIPTAPQQGVSQTLSAMSINCGTAVGPVSVTLSGGGTIPLHDDGIAPDDVAGDGIFTGSWTPPGSGVEPLTFTSSLGSTTVSSPPAGIADQPSLLPSATILQKTVTSSNINAPFSQTFATTGGIPPFSWSIRDGSLPAGLTLNEQTGEIAGTPTAAGVYLITLQLSDSLGQMDRKAWTLLLNQGMRPGWPRELQQRVGTGFLYPSPSPVLADLDGGGKDAIIVADVDTLYVYYSDGTFRKTVLPGSVYTTPAVADLDGDGKKEIIVSVSGYSSSNSIYAFHTDLTPVSGFPAGAYPTINGGTGFVSSPVVADFNGDGQLKIVVVASPNNENDPNFHKNVLIVVDSHGQMVSGWPQIFGDHNDFDTPPAVGDVDHDGRKELVFASSDGNIRVFRADGTLVKQWQIDTAPMWVWSPLLADMNNDGYLDIVVKYNNSVNGADALKVFDRNGTILPGWPKIFSDSPTVPLSPIVADVDGDGRPEIVAVSGNWHQELHALRGDGSSPPGWPVIIPTDSLGHPGFECNPVVADIDGDGHQKVLISTVDLTWQGRLLAFGSDGALVPGFPKYILPGSELRTSPAIGDLDGNGKLDLVVKSENGFLHVWEMEQDASGKERQWPMYRGDPQHSGTWLSFGDPLLPIISGTPSASAPAGKLYTFIPTALGADGFSIANKPAWASFNTATGELTGTPTYADIGTYNGIVISARNALGSISFPAFSITVDMYPLSINNGNQYTTSTTVALNVYMPKGQPYVRFSNDGITWSKLGISRTTMAWNLASGDGLKTVFAQFGSYSNSPYPDIYTASIILDTKAPVGSVKINDGVLYTNNRAVTLSVSATDMASGVARICVKETSIACVDGEFVPFVASMPYTLASPGDGKKTVYAILIDRVGKISKPLKASIILDTIAPIGSISINNGAATATSPTVKLKLTAVKASEMQLSLDDGATWGDWEKFAGSKTVILPAEAGEKSVAVKFRDLAGNVSEVYTAHIALQ
jgi:subtilisin family serine protease